MYPKNKPSTVVNTPDATNEFDDYAHEADRPGNVFVNVIKSVINDSPAMLKEIKLAHPIYFSRADKSLAALTKAFDEIEKLMIDAEANRPRFVADKKKVDDRNGYREDAQYISETMEKIRNGETAHGYQLKLRELDGKLRDVRKQQADALAAARQQKQTENDNAKSALVKVRDAHQKSLADATAILDDIEAQIDKLNCTSCFPKKKTELTTSLESQRKVVNSLQANVDGTNAKLKLAPIPVIEDIQSSEEEIQLQKDYDLNELLLKDCINHRDEILQKKQTDLNELNLDISSIVRSLRQEAQAHYLNVNATVMHGLVRLYVRYHEFKDAFDVGVVQYKPDYAAMRKEIDLAKLEKLADQIRCDEFGGQSIKQIYDQYTALDQANKDKLMKQAPDSTTLKQVFGIPKVSKLGMFAASAEEQKAKSRHHREHLKRQAGEKNILAK